MTCCKPFSRHTAVVVSRRYQQKPHFVSIVCGKHLLLVDDMVTTGTTLSEAANCLLQIEDAQVSVATIAFAKSPLP
ncbi:MAG: hypothetical protein CMC80_03980 [Flavobacteriaceae bacterium]|nr:hypothetical protein [Flavobacteriaceae bacterium]